MTRQGLVQKIKEEVQYRVIEQIEKYGDRGYLEYDDMEVDVFGHLTVCKVEATYPESSEIYSATYDIPAAYSDPDVDIEFLSIEILGKDDYEPAHPNLDKLVNEIL